MRIDFSTVAQILILTMGIYLALSFLRTTRGSGLVRGLGLTMTIGVALLYGVSRNLEWKELQVVIQGIVGFLIVILAIIFQPELRRGIVSLGEHKLLGRFIQSHRSEVLAEVVAALISMAKKKQGALIAFERQTPLDAYIEAGVRVDSEVNRLLLDSIFHHGSALHDGAVVIRGDRVVAAACLFPLTENDELSKSTGTRHRAALGLTEETDAVTVTVSEETGFISVCKGGKLERRVARADIESILRERIGADERDESEDEEARPVLPAAGIGTWLKGAFTQHLSQKATALLMAIVVFIGAYSQVREDETYTVQIEYASVADAAAADAPSAGKLRILLPNEKTHVAAPAAGTSFEVEVYGTRDEHGALALGLGGVVRLGEDLQDQKLDLTAADVRWGSGLAFLDGIEVSWKGVGPRLEIARFETIDVPLLPEHLRVDASKLDRYYEARESEVTFSTETATVLGPLDAIGRLQSGERAFALKPFVMEESPRKDEILIELTDELAAQQLSIQNRVFAKVPIVPTELALDVIEVDVTLQCFDPERQELLQDWEKPSQKVHMNVYARGILPRVDAGSPTDQANRRALVKYVQDNVRCFVDIAKVQDSGGRLAEVETGGLDDWREHLGDLFPVDQLDAGADLWVQLTEADAKLLLERTADE